MDEELDGVAAQAAQKNKKIDPKHGADVSEPPHPISQLVRSGVLMPPRSSVVDGANRKMLSESGGAVSLQMVAWCVRGQAPEPHGRDSWGFACPPTAQPILRFFDPMGPKGGTDQKLAVLLGGKHGFGPSQVY